MKFGVYDDFSASGAVTPARSTARAQPGGDNTAAFDKGYKEGWTDAIKSAERDDEKARADISTALQEAGFTYFEARQHVLNSLKPLLDAMVETVLPRLGRETLGPQVVEEVIRIAKATETPIKIICAPATQEELEGAIAQRVSFPVEIECEPSFADSQIQLKFDQGEASIDPTALSELIKDALDKFYELSKQKELKHA
jgi:flagellar assembly protein FliH